MGLFLKQSTSVTVQIGPFVDNGDGDTDESGFTLEDGDVLLSKNGGAFAQKHDASNCTYDTAGFYRCPLDDTDTDTLGRLQLDVHVVGALHVYHEYMVVTANVYDSMCSTDVLQVDLTQIGGVAQSATDLKDFADTGYDPTTHTVYSLSATGVDNIWDELMAGHVTADSAAYVMRSLQSLISTVNLAQAGAAGSITLAAGESAVNDYYKGQTVCIVTGTGAGQARACYAYNGGTKVASTRPDWATNPDNTSYYAILNVGSTVTAAIEAAVVDSIWDEVMDANAPADANSARELINVVSAVLAGKSSGGGTDTIVFRDVGDTKNRVSATVDDDGNRDAVGTLDGT